VVGYYVGDYQNGEFGAVGEEVLRAEQAADPGEAANHRDAAAAIALVVGDQAAHQDGAAVLQG